MALSFWLASRPCDGCGAVPLAHKATETLVRLVREAWDVSDDAPMATVKCSRCGRINWITAGDYRRAA